MSNPSRPSRAPITASRDRFVDVREPGTGKRLLRFFPEGDIIEVQRRGAVTTICLRELRGEGEPLPTE
jgi:hypothetical protein